jgi:hypothetical protein
MPYPPFLHIIPLRKYLLHPLQYYKPIILKTQAAPLKDEPLFRLPEDPGKEGKGLRVTEQGFPVVNTGTDMVPHSLFKDT